MKRNRFILLTIQRDGIFSTYTYLDLITRNIMADDHLMFWFIFNFNTMHTYFQFSVKCEKVWKMKRALFCYLNVWYPSNTSACNTRNFLLASFRLHGQYPTKNNIPIYPVLQFVLAVKPGKVSGHVLLSSPTSARQGKYSALLRKKYF